MSADRASLSRETLREQEAPGDLLRRYLAAAGWQAIGYVLIVAGFLALVIGWFGVSRESIVAKQIPYLVSGGLGGAFMLAVGTLLLITHELRLDNRRLETVEALVEELRDALLLDEERAPAPRLAAADAVTPVEAGANGTAATFAAGDDIPHTNGITAKGFAVVAGGTRYHVPTCASTVGKQVTYLADDSLRASGLKPCRLCSPDAAISVL